MDKKFKISAEEMKEIATGFGACIATDKITVDGQKVGYMYREEPDSPLNGWVFTAGNETQEYMDNWENMAIYDTNTIANYDPDITEFIALPVGSECERNQDGILVEIKI